MEPRGPGAYGFYSDFGSRTISKKQTVVGITYFKVFFFSSLPILNLLSSSIIVLSLMLEKPYVKITELNCYFFVQGLRQA